MRPLIYSPKVADLLARMDAMKVELSHLEADCDDDCPNEIENIQAAWGHLSDARDALSYVEV